MKVRSTAVDSDKLVRMERAKWRDKNQLAPNALNDFQQLTDETFLELRNKYFGPADLVAEMMMRKKMNVRKHKRRARRG